MATRAEQILQLIDEVDLNIGEPKPFRRATNVFRSQYRYAPGQKIPIHQKIRQDKQRQMISNRKAAYPAAHTTSAPHFRDKRERPLDNNYKRADAERTG